MNLLTLLTLAPAFQGLDPTVATLKVVEGVHPVAIAASPTGRRVAVALEDGQVRILDSTTRQTIRKLAKHPQPCYALAWSPDGAFLASGDESARVFVEDTRNGGLVRQYRTATKGIQKLSFNAPRTLLAATGKDDTIRVYELSDTSKKEKYLLLGKGANFYSATFHPKLPTTLVTGILGSGGRQYDVVSGKVTAFITGHGGQGVWDTAFNASGTRLVTAGRDNTAILWDTKGYKKLGSFKGHQDWVMSAVFSPNGKYVATASTDRTVRIWNTFTFKKVAEIKDETSVGSPLSFSADGAVLASVDVAGNLQFSSVKPAQSDPVAVTTKVRSPRRYGRS
jgi:WD40 repeat protein